MKRALVLVLLAATACGHGKAPKFNQVASAPATAPAAAPSLDPNGSSDVTIAGEMPYATHADFQCTYAIDDFFVRGVAGVYAGLPIYVSINVEKFKQPGRFAGHVQVLIRRVSDDGQQYFSWYDATASATVHPKGGGLDLDRVTLQPESGTQARAPITVAGHFGCEGDPKPGSG